MSEYWLFFGVFDFGFDEFWYKRCIFWYVSEEFEERGFGSKDRWERVVFEFGKDLGDDINYR